MVTKIVYKDQKDNEEVGGLRKEIERLKGILRKEKEERRSVEKPREQEREKKCLDTGDEDKIEIKFPPAQKKRLSVDGSQRPPSSTKLP